MSSILHGNKYSPEGSRVPTDLLPKAIRYEKARAVIFEEQATLSAPTTAYASSVTTNVERWRNAQTQGNLVLHLRATSSSIGRWLHNPKQAFQLFC